MDPFAVLDEALGVEVMKQIDDFCTLQLLLRASPTANSLFDGYAFEILDAVASNSLDLGLPRLFHCLVLINGDRVPQTCPSEESFNKDYIEPDVLDLTQLRQLPTSCLRRVLRYAANIERLAPLVLTKLMDRLHSIVPLDAVDREDYAAHWMYPCIWRFTGAGSVATTTRFPVDPDSLCRQPSWIEVFRVKRALWRLQLAVDLRDRASWVEFPQHRNESQRNLDHGRGLKEGWRLCWGRSSSRTGGSCLEYYPVATVLDDMGSEWDSTWPAAPPPPPWSLELNDRPPQMWYPQPFCLPRLPRRPQTVGTPVTGDLRCREPSNKTSKQWQENPEPLQLSRAMHILSRMFNVHMWAGLREGSPVLGGLLLQAIWRLGLPIWDLRRMRGLGLATDLIIEGGELSTEPLVRSKATVAFTWFSILGFSGKERTHSPSLPDADNSIVSI